MRKYLTQHSFNALTIKLPRNSLIQNQTDISLEMGSVTSSEGMLLIRFADFVKSQASKGFDKLPIFNFLLTFYDVQLVTETDDLLEFNLIINKVLNESIWSRLKHTVFNQYNALIGFSEVLKEVEDLDDTDRLLIHRINDNARGMFENTKLLLEFEQMKDLNYELKSDSVPPLEYLSSYLKYRSNKAKDILLDYHQSEFDNIVLNIDNELFNGSLDLFFNNLEDAIEMLNASFQLSIKQHYHIYFECKYDTVKDAEFFQEVQLINDFFEQGINLDQISSRMFHLMYIRLIAEKLGGKFKMGRKEAASLILFAEWIFPIKKMGVSFEPGIRVEHSNNDIAIEATKPNEQYPIELRKEIATHFLEVDGTFVLDDWKVFADKLETVCLKYKSIDITELNQIVQDIRFAVDDFDIKSLHLIMSKLKRISKT